jgi:putative sterol carrier protein
VTDAASLATFHEIRQGVENRSNDEIHAFAARHEGGTEALLDLVFANLPGAFLPERSGGKDISFQFVINEPGASHPYYADVRDNVCAAGRGELPDPRVTLAMDLAVFLQILTGAMAPVRAFLLRKIQVTGDTMSAIKFESWFARP